MTRAKGSSLLFLVIASFSFGAAVHAQSAPTSLRPGQPIERTIAQGETHAFGVRLEQNQFLQVVVDQRGIDVVVRVFAPDGKRLGEFDSPNGANGPEGVSLVAHDTGLYRIEVAPLGQDQRTASGRYEIRILDLRQATKEELESANGREAAQNKGIALLVKVAEMLPQIRLPETRIRAQIQSAGLLRRFDEKSAKRLVDEAIAGVNEYLASLATDDPNYYQNYQTATQLRFAVTQSLASDDPELALSFLRSTRTLVDPNAAPGAQETQELQLELSLAGQIAAKDPKRALEIARESLKNGYSYNLIASLGQLQRADPESAAKLAGDLAAKLQGENLLKNQTATGLLLNLLQAARPSAPSGQANLADLPAKPPLLAESQYQEIFNKALSAALAYTPAASANYYTPERDVARNILSNLQSLGPELERYAPGKAAAVQKVLTDLNTPPDPRGRLMQQFQQTINSGSVGDALEAASKGPEEIREQLYQQIATKAAAAGDLGLAKQIVSEHLTSPFQRQQALQNLDQQAVYRAINSGKLAEALEVINRLRMPKERAMMLIQVINQVGAAQKRATVLSLLEQARGLVGDESGRAEDQEQMNLLFMIAQAYVALEPKHSFEIIEPIVDQFNEMGAAAVVLNGFGQQYLQNGELLLQNGNILAAMAGQMNSTLGALAASDFDRAKAVADRLQRTEVRLAAYLAIAQQTIMPQQAIMPQVINGPRPVIFNRRY